MTEQELTDRQRELGGERFLVARSGTFYLACSCGAFALSRATGYRVMRRERKGGRHVLTCGFPAGRLEGVMEQIAAAGGVIEARRDGEFEFSGIDGSPGGLPVAEETGREKPKKSPSDGLRETILAFDLSRSTPMEAMMFVDRLQRMARET